MLPPPRLAAVSQEEVYRLAYQLYWHSFLEEYGKTDHKSLRTAKELCYRCSMKP